MPILILNLSVSSVDNYPEQLVQLLDGREIKIVNNTEELATSMAAVNEFNGLIVVGDYSDNPPLTDAVAVTSGDSTVSFVIGLLQSTEWPVLTAGFGFELLCAASGINLSQFGGRGAGAEKIEPTTEGSKLFQGSDPLRVKPTERWLTDEFPKKLQVLARSDTGVEAVKHKTRPVYGLQQRPEDFAYPSDAKMVYRNIFSAFDQYNAKRP